MYKCVRLLRTYSNVSGGMLDDLDGRPRLTKIQARLECSSWSTTLCVDQN